MQRVTVSTLGCRLNQFESDAIERLLGERGYRLVGDDASCDVHIINSCTITHLADGQAQQMIRKIHREQPEAHIVVTGCYATASPAELTHLPGVSLVVGNGSKEAIVQHLDALVGRDRSAGGLRPSADPAADSAPGAPSINQPAARQLAPVTPAVQPRRSRTYLKVQDGCDLRCAFCIVPTVRGKSRSLPIATLVAQLDDVIAAGAAEVVLTGVHLGTYGRDLTPRVHLTDLLRELLPRLRGSRLRLSSLDPHEVGPDLIALMAAHTGKFCRYFHLPVQSVDGDTLKRMRRAHTAEDFTRLVPHLARAIPGVGMGSDIIVGFPQESDAAFANTYDAVEALPLSYVHVFSYSNRRGTVAADMPGQVAPQVIAERSRRLRALSDRKRRTFVTSQLEQPLVAVVHRARHVKTGTLVGITDNYIRVAFEGPDSLLGQAVVVRPERVTETGAQGTLLDRAV